jgi:calcineurin-like phosphoesterase family protein
MKKNFWTSDWHLGHAACLQFDHRPFETMDDMYHGLIKRYNATVPKDGVGYFVGDMVVGNKDVCTEVIKQLNGTKIMILGNHDRGPNSMVTCGFDVVMYSASLFLSNNIVTVAHCPLLGVPREDLTGFKTDGQNWHGEPKNKRFSVPDFGQFHLHGHIHSPNEGRSKRILGRQLDVGVVANNYTPVSVSQVESWIVKTLKEENLQTS